MSDVLDKCPSRDCSIRNFNFQSFCRVMPYSQHIMLSKIIKKMEIKNPDRTSCSPSIGVAFRFPKLVLKMSSHGENGITDMKGKWVRTATSITQPNPTTTVSWEFSLFFQGHKCIASTATSSIILLRNNKSIVERNSDNKPDGCISQKGNIKFFVSHSTDISDLGPHNMLSYRLLDTFKL